MNDDDDDDVHTRTQVVLPPFQCQATFRRIRTTPKSKRRKRRKDHTKERKDGNRERRKKRSFQLSII